MGGGSCSVYGSGAPAGPHYPRGVSGSFFVLREKSLIGLYAPSPAQRVRSDGGPSCHGGGLLDRRAAASPRVARSGVGQPERGADLATACSPLSTLHAPLTSNPSVCTYTTILIYRYLKTVYNAIRSYLLLFYPSHVKYIPICYLMFTGFASLN